jgi:hypothetical protein
MWEALFSGSSLLGSLMQGVAPAVANLADPKNAYNRVEDPYTTYIKQNIAKQRGQVGQIRNQNIQNMYGSLDKTGSMGVDKMAGTLSNLGETSDNSMLGAIKTNARAGGLTPALSNISGINKDYLGEQSSLNTQDIQNSDQVMYFKNGLKDPMTMWASLLKGGGESLSNLPTNMTNAQGNAKLMRMFQQLLDGINGGQDKQINNNTDTSDIMGMNNIYNNLMHPNKPFSMYGGN